MSIRFQRTPLVAAVLLFLAAGAGYYFMGMPVALIAAGASLLLLALSMLGGRSSDPHSEDSNPSPTTVPFGPAASEVSGPLTRAEKKAAKKAEAEVKKKAAADAKFTKKAEAEAKKAAKKAAVDAKKAEAEAKKKAAADAKKAKKAERKANSDEDFETGEDWITELRAMNEENPMSLSGDGSPFGVTVEALEVATEATPATARTISFDETGEIPVVASNAPAYGSSIAAAAASYVTPTPPHSAPDPQGTPVGEWILDAYMDPSFAPPFTTSWPEGGPEESSEIEVDNMPATLPAAPSDEIEVDDMPATLDVAAGITEPVVAMIPQIDEGILGPPAEVETVFADDTSEPTSPAYTIKRMADQFQDLAAEISHEWTRVTAIYEQRDQLAEALQQAQADNASLLAEIEAAEGARVDADAKAAALASSLEEARSEVSRLYEEARETSHLKYMITRNVTHLRELRFRITSDPSHDPALLAVIDAALSESE